MATFTVIANQNWDSSFFNTRAGGDLYNMSAGARLTIDTDTRYCLNTSASLGVMGQIGLNASATNISGTCGELYIDGSKVRIIPFTGGTGSVPAIGTLITEGSVSSELLGVWPSFIVPPQTPGTAINHDDL